jgi:hypothetical protein
VAVTDLAEYRALYPVQSDYRMRGDASVSTMYYYERALPEVLRICPEVRLVVLLREPISRAFSAFQYMSARGFEPEDDFGKALADEDRRVREGWHHLWHYTRMSYYAEAVEHMVGAVGRERVGLWFYDDLQEDYEGTVSQVLRFLGVPSVPGEAEGVPRVNISGTPRFRTLQRGIWAATGNEKVRNGVKRVTSYRMREAVRRRLLSRSSVPREIFDVLEPAYGDDLRRIAALMERPLPSWMPAHDGTPG